MSTPEAVTPHQPVPDIRIVQLDILRGVAVLGIYWINVMVFALPHSAYALPVLIGDATTANSLVWGFSELYVNGTMRGLFSMLFGASAMLFLDEARLAGGGLEVVDRYYRRTLLLMLFGLLHAWLLLWPNDVLYAYGLLGLFLFPLRKLSPHLLLIVGMLLLVLGDLGDMQAAPAKSAETTTSPTVVKDPKSKLSNSELSQSIATRIDEDIRTYQSGYRRIFNSQKNSVIEQQSTNMYTSHFFDIGGMMLIGMGLFRMGILSGRRPKEFYLQLMLFAYLCGFLFRAPDIYESIVYGFSMTRVLGYDSPLYNIGRLAMTLGHIGLICLLCQMAFFSRIARLLAKVGRMALTNYIMQSVFSIFIFYGIGLGLYARLERYQLLYICLAVWVLQILISIFWLKRFHYGPLEWVWRSLIYGQRQKMKRQAGT